MNLVIDANIIFACLIKEGKTHELFFNENLHLYTPEFFFTELEKHQKEIISKTKRTEQEYAELFKAVKKKISLIPIEELLPTLEEAEKTSPDPDDIAYFALALKLKCPIWTNDKQLKKQDEVKIITTEELTKIIAIST